MAGPWERYQQPAAAPPQDGPWARYAQAPAAQQQPSEADRIAQFERASQAAYAGTGTDRYGGTVTDLPAVQALPPDFSGVSAEVSSTGQMLGPDGRMTEQAWQTERDRLAAQDPLEGTGWYQRYLAGLGKSGVDTVKGLQQLGVDAIGELAGDRTGLTGTSKMESLITGEAPGSNAVTRWAARKGQELREQTAQRRKEEAPITDSVPGMAGNVVGTLGQLFTPGMALRGTAAARGFLPTTIRGNALQGGALGATQPVAEQGERGRNTSIGLLGGGAGAAIPRAVGAVGSPLMNLLGRPSVSGAERSAGQLILGESSGLQGLMTPQPSAVPGVQRTLAEETLDPGIARLERQMRGQTNVFQPIDTANNAARVRAIEQFAGDPAAITAAERARNAAAKPLLGQAYLDKGVDVGAVRSTLDAQIKANATRPSVQSALLDVQGSLEKAGDDVFSLYGTRKYIDDLLSGKAGSDKSYARAARKELMAVKEVLDDKLAEKSPSFAQYLDAYRAGSKPINRMQAGQQLLAADSGGAVLDPQTGVQVLTPASFSRKARDLDAVAAKATGFKKARADQIFQPEDIATIRAVQDDLERQSFRATAGSGGNSMTQERQALQDRMGRRLATKVPFVGGFVEALDQLGNQRVNERLAYLMANPDEARRVLAALNREDRAVLNRALIQISARTGASTPAFTE